MTTISFRFVPLRVVSVPRHRTR